MFFKKYGDLVVGIFFMALGVVLYVAAAALPKSAVMEIGPDFMPKVIAALTFVLALVLTIQSAKGLKSKEIDPASVPKSDYKRVISSIILVLIYVFVMRPVGFIITTLVFLPLQMLILSPDDKRGVKNIVVLLVIDVIFTIAVYLLFRYAFMIMLPRGPLTFI